MAIEALTAASTPVGVTLSLSAGLAGGAGESKFHPIHRGTDPDFVDGAGTLLTTQPGQPYSDPTHAAEDEGPQAVSGLTLDTAIKIEATRHLRSLQATGLPDQITSAAKTAHMTALIANPKTSPREAGGVMWGATSIAMCLSSCTVARWADRPVLPITHNQRR